MYKKKLHDSCGNELNVGDRVSWYKIIVSSDLGSQSTQEYRGKIIDWFGHSVLVVLPDYALLALAPINYLERIKAYQVTKIK